MVSFKSLAISDYHGAPLSNTFMQQKQAARQLGIVLPGMGYTAHMPVLYYPTRLLTNRGADVLCVEYNYYRKPAFADAAAALEAGLAQRAYERIVLVGKSLGTLAMGHLITTDARLAQAPCIWLTPIVRNETLRQQITQAKPHSLFVIGTADSHYDPGSLAAAVEATRGQRLVIEGADHSLEIAGSISESIRAMEQVVQAVTAFLDEVS
jgi:predicted alpha/beta hydrolase family esterase